MQDTRRASRHGTAAKALASHTIATLCLSGSERSATHLAPPAGVSRHSVKVEGEFTPAPNGARRYLPTRLSLSAMREAVDSCRGCDLHQNATQAVMGEGLKRATLMVVGEQPGDSEDVEGRPFVGPSGKLLRNALLAAGIPSDQVYLTNAVKHFKWKPRGKKRMHDKPDPSQVAACKPWLLAELQVVKPKILLVLGSTAAQALLGPSFRVTQHRRELLHTEWAPFTFATLHPSALLRIPDDTERRSARADYVEELRTVWEYADQPIVAH